MYESTFRVQQEMGLEPKRGSMSPAGAPAPDSGPNERALVQRFLDLPSDQFLEVVHRHYAKHPARTPPPEPIGPIIDVESGSPPPPRGGAGAARARRGRAGRP